MAINLLSGLEIFATFEFLVLKDKFLHEMLRTKKLIRLLVVMRRLLGCNMYFVNMYFISFIVRRSLSGEEKKDSFFKIYFLFL